MQLRWGYRRRSFVDSTAAHEGNPIIKHPAVPYVAPFAGFMAFIALAHWLPVSPRFLYPLRVVVVVMLVVVCSRQLISFRARNWAGSILMGIAVFVLWI